MKANKRSRMEANKIVRQVLHRHGVDLTYTQYSVAGRDIRLTGYLSRLDGGKYNANMIESMIYEFQRYLAGYTISGDFDNWSFTQDHICYLGDKGPKIEYQHSEDEDLTDYEEAG